MDTPTILRAASMIGLSSSLWLSGIYFGSSQLTLPILYRFPAATSADIFQEFYYRGIPTIVPLVAGATISFGTASYLNEKKRTQFAIAAALVLASMPWTTFYMMGTIQKLIEIAKDEKVRISVGQKGTVDLLKQWHWMNLVRSAMVLAGGLTGLFAYAG